MSSGPEYYSPSQRFDHGHIPNKPIMTAQPMTMPIMSTRQPVPTKRQPKMITLLLIVALVTLMIVSLIEGAFFLMIMNGEL